MMDRFSNLNEEESKQLFDALPLITILIAGADGKIENEEMEWGEKLTHIRSYKLKGELKTFYKEVESNFSEKVNYFIEALPSGVKQRNDIISKRLSDLNPILAKLEPAIGFKVYSGLVSFAKHIAKASGGLMGFFSVNAAEAKLIGLPMLDPIDFIEDEEE